MMKKRVTDNMGLISFSLAQRNPFTYFIQVMYIINILFCIMSSIKKQYKQQKPYFSFSYSASFLLSHIFLSSKNLVYRYIKLAVFRSSVFIYDEIIHGLRINKCLNIRLNIWKSFKICYYSKMDSQNLFNIYLLNICDYLSSECFIELRGFYINN